MVYVYYLKTMVYKTHTHTHMHIYDIYQEKAMLKT